MISLNVVVWDETNVIDRCVKSAIKSVDEIVFMVDRSCRFTDRLMKYASKIIVGDLAGTIVEHHRNELIKASSGDWILVLDPDEWIDHNLAHALQSLCNTASEELIDGLYLPRYNIVYDKDYNLIVGDDYPDWNLRLFRDYARYSGIIYEDNLTMGTVGKPLGLGRVEKCAQGILIHDKVWEDVEEVRRTEALYKKWESGNG